MESFKPCAKCGKLPKLIRFDHERKRFYAASCCGMSSPYWNRPSETLSSWNEGDLYQVSELKRMMKEKGIEID